MIEAVVNATVWSILDKWSRLLLGLGTLVLLARLLPPEAFGVVAAAYFFIEFSELLMSQGLGLAIVQRADLEPEHLHTAFWINTATALVLAGVMILGASVAASVVGDPQVTPVLRWMSAIMPLNALTRVPIAILTRELAFRSIGLRTFIQTMVSSAVAIGMALAGFGVWSLVGQQATRAIVGFATLWWATDYRPKLVFSGRHWADLWPFSWKVLLDQAVLFVSRRADEAIVAMFLDVVALGVYSVAKRISLMLLTGIGGAINAVAIPSFSKLQRDPERMPGAVLDATRLTAAAIFPAMIGLAAISPEAIPLLFGAQWKPAVEPGVIIAIAGIFTITPTVLHSAYHAMSTPGVPLTLNVLRALLVLVLLPPLARWELIGVALAFLARDALTSVLDAAPARRILGVRMSALGATTLPALAASGCMAALVRGAASITAVMPAVWQVAIMIGAGAAAYVLFLAMFDRKTFAFFHGVFAARAHRVLARGAVNQ